MRRSSLVLAGFLAITSAAPQLRADEGAAAEALFEAGRIAAKRGETREACAKFRESYRIEPAPGTKLNLAVCEGKLGRLALSWRLLRSLSKSLRPEDPRRRLVEELLATLDQRVPRVTFEPSGPLPPGVVVTIEGVVISESGFRVPIPVDPGRNSYHVVLPDRAPTSHAFDVSEGERRTILVTARSSPALPPGANTRDGSRSAGSPALRTSAILAFGAAASAVVVGAATGFSALEQKWTMDQLCTEEGCEPGGIDAARHGKALAAWSTGAFIAGAVLAGAGATFLLLDRAARRGATISLRVSPAGLALRAEL